MHNFIYNGGASKRYHTVQTLTTQDIAAHSFGVAWLCELITAGRARKVLVMAALAHDLAEHLTGDIPSPAKREMGLSNKFHEHEMDKLRFAGVARYYDELTDGEIFTLKLADMIDGMFFCLKEKRLGNKNVDIVFGRFLDYANEVLNEIAKTEAAAAWCVDSFAVEIIIDDIIAQWERLNE